MCAFVAVVSVSVLFGCLYAAGWIYLFIYLFAERVFGQAVDKVPRFGWLRRRYVRCIAKRAVSKMTAQLCATVLWTRVSECLHFDLSDSSERHAIASYFMFFLDAVACVVGASILLEFGGIC